jgi:hypothetical protein
VTGAGSEHEPSAAAAAAAQNEGQVTVDEQLARELDEALNSRGHKRKADSQQPEGPRLFNFQAAAAGGIGKGSLSAEDEGQLLAAALAALDAEDAAAAAEAADAQAAAIAAAGARVMAPAGRHKANKQGCAGAREGSSSAAAAAVAAAAAAAAAGDGDDEDAYELTWRQSTHRPRRAVQQRRQQQQQQLVDDSDSDQGLSVQYQGESEESSDDPQQQQQQQGGSRPQRQKQLSAVEQQKQKLLGALARRTQRQQQHVVPSTAAAAAGGADWEPDDEAEEDAALLGVPGRVGGDSSGDDSDSEGEGGQLLLPADVSNLDPAVLSTLPQSVQLDILEKMRDAQQTGRQGMGFVAGAVADAAGAGAGGATKLYHSTTWCRRGLPATSSASVVEPHCKQGAGHRG